MPEESGYGDGPLGWMRRLVIPWLERQDWRPEDLADWLQGYGLPPVGSSEEPYVWLLRGLPEGAERYPLEAEFARRAAKLLEGEPDRVPAGRRPQRLLQNLLMLCAGLSCRDELAEPLYAIFQRAALGGQWQGQDLRRALLAALVMNQRDNRLQAVWEAMSRGEKHRFLGGGRDVGFEGSLRMPPSETRRGEPALEAIGRSLKATAEYLGTDRDRLVEFRSLINRVVETYLLPTATLDLVRLATDHGWPAWTVDCLPNLCFPVDPADDPSEPSSYVLWWPILEVLGDGYSAKTEESFCDALVLRVSVDREARGFIENIGPSFERYRRSNLISSENATTEVIITAICEAAFVVQPPKGDRSRAADTVEKAHKRILGDRIGLIPSRSFPVSSEPED